MKWGEERQPSAIRNLSVMTSLAAIHHELWVLMSTRISKLQLRNRHHGCICSTAGKTESLLHYQPVQDFEMHFLLMWLQNYGANEKKRIKDGIKSAVIMSMVFLCVCQSACIYL
ncbi:MAG: hypothetical protein ACLS54_08920 [Anaerostipes hadrus]